MNMTNKEQLLYFFLQSKISLSQYDYKFMANLQTMIQNKNRVTSNQAILFDNLISKYKKQLSKNGLDKDTLKTLPWKTDVVQSTEEYTGATISLHDNYIIIKAPFNKSFISDFKNTKNNQFTWDKDNKFYRAEFSTVSLKLAYNILPKYFTSIRLDDDISRLIDNINEYYAQIYNPTLCLINGRPVVLAVNSVLGEMFNDIDINIDELTLFKLSCMGITIHEDIYKQNDKLEFASKRIFEADIENIETIITYIKNIGCENVIIGSGLKNHLQQEKLSELITMHGMKAVRLTAHWSVPEGINILLQHTSSIDSRRQSHSKISKIVTLKNSQPIEVK